MRIISQVLGSILDLVTISEVIVEIYIDNPRYLLFWSTSNSLGYEAVLTLEELLKSESSNLKYMDLGL